jgi:hypothetical protein
VWRPPLSHFTFAISPVNPHAPVPAWLFRAERGLRHERRQRADSTLRPAARAPARQARAGAHARPRRACLSLFSRDASSAGGSSTPSALPLYTLFQTPHAHSRYSYALTMEAAA